MFKVPCVLACALCGGRVGNKFFISNYATVHDEEHIKLMVAFEILQTRLKMRLYKKKQRIRWS
jgi:hypothetical protein